MNAVVGTRWHEHFYKPYPKINTGQAKVLERLGASGRVEQWGLGSCPAYRQLLFSDRVATTYGKHHTALAAAAAYLSLPFGRL